MPVVKLTESRPQDPLTCSPGEQLLGINPHREIASPPGAWTSASLLRGHSSCSRDPVSGGGEGPKPKERLRKDRLAASGRDDPSNCSGEGRWLQ